MFNVVAENKRSVFSDIDTSTKLLDRDNNRLSKQGPPSANGDTDKIRLDEKETSKEPTHIINTVNADTLRTRKLSEDYFTVEGVKLRTGYSNKQDWYLFVVREGIDNSIDFLWKFYRGADNTYVKVDIIKEDNFITIKIRNPNSRNIPIFSEQDIKAIFNFEGRAGTKQDVHIISRSMLGDALKQVLALGYILIHSNDDGTTFGNVQWEHPLIIRHNGQEWKIYLHYENKFATVTPVLSDAKLSHTDTEIEFTLPVTKDVHDSLNRDYIEAFCREYSIPTTDISFHFSILDESNYIDAVEVSQQEVTEQNQSQIVMTEIVRNLSKLPPKAILHIDVPALHPIASNEAWSNTDSISSCSVKEFENRFVNVHNKSKTLYEIVLEWREGNNLSNTPKKTGISIQELIDSPDKYDRLEKLYKDLRNTFLDPPKELSLPYTINTKKRKQALFDRISTLYELDPSKKSSYKLVRGYYPDLNDAKVDPETGKLSRMELQYPFAFEIIAIPLANPRTSDNKFIGAINYSISPKGTIFEQKEAYRVETDSSYWDFDNIVEVLEHYGFDIKIDKARLPCIIVGNLITPRRDPKSFDKTSVDMSPFTRTIVTAIAKMSKEIQTMIGAGYRKARSARDYRTAAVRNINRIQSAKEVFRQFLIKERGLPDVEGNPRISEVWD